jgi:hypothetical protein
VTADITNIHIDTSDPTDKILYLRAITSSGLGTYDIPLFIYFCGSESILTSGPLLPIENTYAISSSDTEKIDHSTVTNLLTSSKV